MIQKFVPSESGIAVFSGRGSRNTVINEHPVWESEGKQGGGVCAGEPGGEARCLGPGAGWEGFFKKITEEQRL